MHILYLHQYFATRKGMTGTRSYEFARHLVGKGHRVTMVTSGLANQEFAVPKGKQYAEFETEGIHVVSIAAAYNDPQVGTGMSGWRRMLKFYQFARLAGRIGRKLPRPDVVFATHTPLTIGLAGAALGRYFNVPFVFEVRDLWPEALVNVGALKNPLGILLLRRMAKKIYAEAEHIVALSPGMKEGIVRAGVPAEKITVIPNASDLDLFRPELDGSAACERLGLGDRFAAIYFGAMGMANGLEYVIEAGRILAERGKDNIVLVLHGSGGKRAELEKMAREYELTNVVFSDLVPDKAEVARIVAGCQVCMTIYQAAREHTWSPNKMFDALAAGKPVLINVPGWLGETIENNHCGRCLDPYRPRMLADVLEELAADPNLCRQMGKNARALAEREFAREKLAGQLENVLLEMLKKSELKSELSSVTRNYMNERITNNRNHQQKLAKQRLELFKDKNRSKSQGLVGDEQIMRKRDSHLAEDESVKVVDAGLSNVSDIADCHSLAFKGRFMTEMGHQWLCVLYRYFIKHPGGINLVAVDKRNKVLGFAVGGEPGIRDELIRYAMVRYPNIILFKFLTNSLVRKVMLEVLVKKIFKRKPIIRFSKNSTKQVAAIRTGNLLSICVQPECQGMGVADKLIDSFQKRCSAKGYKRLMLSVFTENARAIAFYRKHCWREVGKSGESSKFVLEL